MKPDIGMFNDQFFFPLLKFESPLTLYLAGYTRPQTDYKIPLDHPLDPALTCYQLEYVTDGKGYIDINGKTYTVEKGDFFFINKTIPRTLYSDTSFPLQKFFITAKGDFMHSLLDLYHIDSSILIVKTDVSEYFQNILNILYKADSYTIDECNKIGIEILKIIQHISLSLQKEEKTLDNSRVAESIMDYIDSNLTRKITIEDLCNQFYMGKTQIIKIFKKKYKMTPMKYAQGQRIVTAKYHLRATNISISNLSDMLCFADSKYFSNVFKSYVGISPQEYRIHYREFGGKEESAFHHDDFVKLTSKKIY